MLNKWFRKLRRTARNWNTDTTRSDRNAVIQRVVAAAAKESKNNLPFTDSEARKPAPAETRTPGPSPLAAQLLGQDEPSEERISGDEIGRRAHEIWLRNGRPMGTASADWMQAEAELRAERQGTRP
jgi:hypothetical protein